MTATPLNMYIERAVAKSYSDIIMHVMTHTYMAYIYIYIDTSFPSDDICLVQLGQWVSYYIYST